MCYTLDMQDHAVRRYFYGGLLLVGAILTALILWPFAKVIILSLALSAVLYPVHRFLKRKLGVSWVAALLTIILFIIVLCIPLFTVGTLVFQQTQSIQMWVVEHGGFDNITSLFNQSISRMVPGGVINLNESITAVVGNLSAQVGSAFSATLATLFSFTLVILSMFYFLKDGLRWKETLLRLSPLSDASDHAIIEKMRLAVNGIVKGYLLIAIIQGVLMGVGLWIFGVPNAALWGVLSGIASLIPTIGTALVAIPAILYLIIAGDSAQAIGFAIWAAAIVGTVDNVLNPFLVGRKIDIHPLLVLFSILGALALMGPIGILIGPLAISFMYALVSVYKTESKV